MKYSQIKRLFDFVFALILLITLSPLLAGVYLLVLWDLGRPALFIQSRPGFALDNFLLVKFRTMSNKVDSSGTLSSDADRLTKIGHFLRRSSIDELPSLFNILIGQMSFVGPRPFAIHQDLYPPESLIRFSVKPGLTGLAQVRGRNSLSWQQKFQYDVDYVKSMSFFGDLAILITTLLVVFVGSGVTAPGHATAPRYNGAKSKG